MGKDTKKFIKKELKKGMKPDSIKKAMVDQGYDSQEIEKDLRKARNDTKRLIFIILAIAVVLIVLYFLVFNYGSDEIPEDEDVFLAGDYTDEEILNMAVIEADTSYCKYILADNMRENCELLASAGSQSQTELEKRDEELLNQAVLEENPALCDLITFEATRRTCERLSQFVQDDVDNTDEDLLNQAVLEKDAAICLLIESEDIREDCQRLVS